MLKCLSLIAAVCSIVLVTGCNVLPPVTPEEPTGPYTGDIGVSYRFTAVTTDPQNLPLRYEFDWGGGGESEWSQYVPSGEPVAMSHAWRAAGTHPIRVRAQDVSGKQSELSPRHVIMIGSQSGYPDTVLATIQVGGDPTDIAVLPNGEFAYVANQTAEYVTVVDVENREVVTHVTCGSSPYMIAASPGGEYVYSSSERDDEISVIRTRDNTVVKRIPVGACPHRLCFSPDGSRCYTANQNDNTVSVIRTSDNTVIASVSVGNIPRDVDCGDEYVYTANVGSTTLTKIRASDNAVVGTVHLGFTPHRVRVMPGGEYVYATEYWGNKIAVVRAADNTLVATIVVNGTLGGMCFVNGGDYLYAASDNNGGWALVIRTSDNTIIDRIKIGAGSLSVRAPDDGAFVASADRGPETVTIIGRSGH
jgi:YVTN family beta-propeller protein